MVEQVVVYVYDANTFQPIAGATVRLLRWSASTNRQGYAYMRVSGPVSGDVRVSKSGYSDGFAYYSSGGSGPSVALTPRFRLI